MHDRSNPRRFRTPLRRATVESRHGRVSRGRASKGIALLAAIALPVTISQLLPLAAHAAGPDTVQFTQTSGSSKAYFKYVPGDGSTVTTQNVTGGGGCSNPTLGPAQTGKTQGSTDPILGFSAGAWFNQNDYSGAGASAIVGAYNGSTGVCALAQNYSIDNLAQPSSGNSKWGTEELDFSTGTNPVDAGRNFARATINVANNTATATHVDMIEMLNGQQIAAQTCSLGATTRSHSPTIVLADTKPDGVTCTGTDASVMGFDTVKIQVPDIGESVSVVSTSTFTLGGGQICDGQTISASDESGSSGKVSASLTLDAPSGTCKSYSNFAVSADYPDSNAAGDNKVVIFSGTGGDMPEGDHLLITIDWGYVANCEPGVCAPTMISFNNGQSYSPQTFCSAASSATPDWCTTSQKFSYVDVNGTTMTHIVETWDGVGDPATRHA